MSELADKDLKANYKYVQVFKGKYGHNKWTCGWNLSWEMKAILKKGYYRTKK